MIRLAEEKDFDILLRMCKSFFDASGYSDRFEYNEPDVKELVRALITDKTMITDGKSGMLGFILSPALMNRSQIIAQELFWWVDEDKRGGKLGLDLLKAAEEQATELGASQLLMLSLTKLNGGKVNKLYESRGYEPRESVYMRAL